MRERRNIQASSTSSGAMARRVRKQRVIEDNATESLHSKKDQRRQKTYSWHKKIAAVRLKRGCLAEEMVAQDIAPTTVEDCRNSGIIVILIG